MTAAEIRQSFLDFFREKEHTIVPSASLLPQSPGLLFTNAGMNQFVPYFLGVEKAPYSPPRAADTQKCIRAGGKHNDLEDVGYDTYHHTMFEMLGNWSFGDYFKNEAIRWAWELVIERWGLPASRLYASVYAPQPGDPGEFDQEAWDIWAGLFRSKGVDPAVHIVNGNVKDNFWMMGETGPCGPCSELHVDLTPDGDSKGKLVNNDSDLCIEIWNLVFIQYNAEADGSFRELPAKHVDTGMGFERACSMIQGTKGFTDFSSKPSNYSTDVFTPIFRTLEELSGKKYVNVYPEIGADRAAFSEEMKDAIAFRVIADHLRTLSFSIADGIMPGNNGRNYVLRRILRRAVRYGRQLGFSGDKPFFSALVATLVNQMGGVFPELKTRQDTIRQTLETEEASFNQTLDRGLKRFEEAIQRGDYASESRGAHASSVPDSASCGIPLPLSQEPPIQQPCGISSPLPASKLRAQGAKYSKRDLPHFERPWGKYFITFGTQERLTLSGPARKTVLDAILHFHGSRYILFAAVVMPDHVHLLIEPQPKARDAEENPVFWSLGELMHSVKSFTANEINRQLGRSGAVWQKESHDRLIRSDSDLGEKFDYILTNPQRAGLTASKPYPYIWSRGWSGSSVEILRSEALPTVAEDFSQDAKSSTLEARAPQLEGVPQELSGDIAFELYDTFGFPIDLTELLCAERGLKVDMPRFEELMEQQRERARSAQKSTIIRALDISTDAVTEFLGFENDECEATVLETHPQDDALFVITDKTVFYAEMGGQSGDTGTVAAASNRQAEIPITGTQQIGKARAHIIASSASVKVGDKVTLKLDEKRRRPIEAHHTATHLLHWALHEVVSRDATQQGSAVDENRLRFDFNSAAVTPEQLAAMEEKVNAAIAANDPVSWREVPHAEIKGRADVMQFFGDKYGDTVRVVQIGGRPGEINGYSMELCGGTHVRRTGEIGLFKIKSEGAIASGVRRIEAVCGKAAENFLAEQAAKDAEEISAARVKLDAANEKLTTLDGETVFISSTATSAEIREAAIEAEKRIKKLQSSQAAKLADEVLSELIAKNEPIIASFESDASLLQELQNGLKKKAFTGPALLMVDDGEKLHLAVHCGPDALAKGLKAGDLLRDLAAIAGGKGGGKPDQARGAAPDRTKQEEIKALAQNRFDP
ncbi:MAG: alanine--tRNA ligase-related protein [Verrucomicrobiota bacterium]